MNNILSSCKNLENINLKNSVVNPSLISSSIDSTFSSKLSICGENENWLRIFAL